MVSARVVRLCLLVVCTGILGCGSESGEPQGSGNSGSFDRAEFARQAEPACEQYRKIKKYRLVLSYDQYPDEVRATRVLIDGLNQAAGASERPRSLTEMLAWLGERQERAVELERLHGGTDLGEPDRLQTLVHDYLVLAGGRRPDPAAWELDLGIPGCTKTSLEAPRAPKDVDERFDEALREAKQAGQ